MSYNFITFVYIYCHCVINLFFIKLTAVDIFYVGFKKELSSLFL